MKDIRELLQTRPLLFDGAMGTLFPYTTLFRSWVLIIRRLPGWSASRPT